MDGKKVNRTGAFKMVIQNNHKPSTINQWYLFDSTIFDGGCQNSQFQNSSTIVTINQASFTVSTVSPFS